MFQLKRLSINGKRKFLLCVMGASALILIAMVATNQAITRHYSDDLLTRIEGQYGADAVKRLTGLSAMVDASGSLSESEKVRAVNDYFNKVPYYTDAQHWKQVDYWATPVEKLATNGGDCEDYSIAKYYTLRELGVPEEKLRIMYVKAIEWNEAHMVLAYYPEPSFPPLVLDNINPSLLTSDKRKDLVPVYSFNANGLYLAKAQGTGKRVGGPEKLKLWTNLTKRMDGSDI